MAQEHMETFIKQLGVRDDIIESLKAEELDPDFDSQAAIDEIRSEQKKLFFQSERDNFVEKAEHEEVITRHKIAASNKYKKDLSDNFNLGLKRRDSDSMTTDEVWAKIKESLEALKTPPDESELQGKLDDWVKKYQDLDTHVHDLEAKKVEEIDSLKLEYENKFRMSAVNKLLDDKLNQVDWARKDQNHIDREFIKNKLFGKFDVYEDGKLMDKEGGMVATPFEGNTPYRNVDEAITYLVKKNKLDSQSNGNKKDSIISNGVPIASDKISDSTKRMYANVEKAKQAGRG